MCLMRQALKGPLRLPETIGLLRSFDVRQRFINHEITLSCILQRVWILYINEWQKAWCNTKTRIYWILWKYHHKTFKNFKTIKYYRIVWQHIPYCTGGGATNVVWVGIEVILIWTHILFSRILETWTSFYMKKNQLTILGNWTFAVWSVFCLITF